MLVTGCWILDTHSREPLIFNDYFYCQYPVSSIQNPAASTSYQSPPASPAIFPLVTRLNYSRDLICQSVSLGYLLLYRTSQHLRRGWQWTYWHISILSILCFEHL